MLEEVLKALSTGHTWSVDELSEKLGMTKENTLAAIAFLEQANYIKRIKFCAANGSCGKCHACEGMDILNAGPIMWEVVK